MRAAFVLPHLSGMGVAVYSSSGRERNMIRKRGGKIWLWVLCVCSLNARIQAVVEDSADSPNPYSAIWLRNAFDLKSPSVATIEAAPTNLPPPNVQLTGITTILGNKRALFMVQDPPAPGKPAGPPQSYILTEGERQGALEVLEINTKAATVKIKNKGVLSTIALETKKPDSEPAIGAAAVGGQGVPRGRPVLLPRINPGFGAVPIPNSQTPDGSASVAPANYAAMVPQASYTPPAYSGGFQGGYAQPAPVATPAPNSNNAQSQTPSVPASSISTSASANSAMPVITSQMQVAIAAAEAAAADGRLTPPAFPPGVSAPTPAEVRAGAPPLPNFPTPPPLPASAMGLVK
jgi:hypothetical protein